MKSAIYSGAAVACGGSFAAGAAGDGPIVDAHIHLFDPRRPGGIPWPEKTDTILYRPALPDRYASVSAKFGVVGAIAIEASPSASDNDWLLGVAKKYPLMVGVIGDLVPGGESYSRELERLHRNALFLGFRYGNLWKRNLAADIQKPGFVDGLKQLAAAGLVFESANPDAALLGALTGVGEQVPALRMVIDHLPHAVMAADAATRRGYQGYLHRLAANPRVFIKLSEIPVLRDGRLVTDAGFYREALDTLWDDFGEDRVLYGSDWPNSDSTAGFAETFNIVRSYVLPRGRVAMEKFYWQNSIAAYKWRRRLPGQPGL